MSGNNVPLVLNTMFRPFILELVRRGIDSGALLASCGIENENLLEGEYYLAVRSWYDFAEACAEAAGDRYFGFTVGHEAALPKLANFELIDLSQGSLGDLLAALILDARRVISAARYTITNDGEWVNVITKRVFRPREDPAQIDAFFAANMSNAFRIYSARRWSPERLTIWVSDVSAVPVPTLNGVKVLPGDRSGADFRFPASWMLQTADEIVERAEWAERQRRERFILDFRTMLAGQLDNPNLTMAGAARDISVSASTLRRELERHGTSFTALVTELRTDRVKQLLQAGDLPIAEAGKRIGFADPSSFARAFRSWTGMTPRDYRNSVLG